MNDLHRTAADLTEAASNLERQVDALIGQFADEMVAWLKREWPRRTGYSGDAWRAERSDVLKWKIVCPAEYASFVHRKGDPDRARNPIYPVMLEEAAKAAGEVVDVSVKLTDLTAAYLGKGFKFKITNVLWLEMTGRVAPGTADNTPWVKTEKLPGGIGGSFTVG